MIAFQGNDGIVKMIDKFKNGQIKNDAKCIWKAFFNNLITRRIFHCFCDIDKVQLVKLTDHKKLDRNVREATFQVDVLLDYSAIKDYFKERSKIIFDIYFTFTFISTTGGGTTLCQGPIMISI